MQQPSLVVAKKQWQTSNANNGRPANVKPPELLDQMCCCSLAACLSDCLAMPHVIHMAVVTFGTILFIQSVLEVVTATCVVWRVNNATLTMICLHWDRKNCCMVAYHFQTLQC
jgi:hypothetical protein